MSKKYMVSGLIVCWACRNQDNNAGPLIKVDATNYAHKKCHESYGKPGASNQSVIPIRHDEEKVESKIVAQIPKI